VHLYGTICTETNDVMLHSMQAELSKAQNSARRMAERSMDAQRASATVPRDTVQLYQQLAASGLQYGPAFRLLRNVHVPDTTTSSS
jgi:hypothetical protein